VTGRKSELQRLTRWRSAPESQGVITVNVTALARQNLQEVGRLVEAIATGRYRVPAYDVNMFASVEGYIQDAIPAFTEWILTRTYFLESVVC
jgi:hypothetical protein